jgi:hypothetical protein
MKEDDNSIFVEGSYFESSRGGLLAGERLLMALQTMERRYLETNYRKNEIDQAFSLTQINPAALLVLKQTGECTFDIPEVYFDLFYPGTVSTKDSISSFDYSLRYRSLYQRQCHFIVNEQSNQNGSQTGYSGIKAGSEVENDHYCDQHGAE